MKLKRGNSETPAELLAKALEAYNFDPEQAKAYVGELEKQLSGELPASDDGGNGHGEFTEKETRSVTLTDNEKLNIVNAFLDVSFTDPVEKLLSRTNVSPPETMDVVELKTLIDLSGDECNEDSPYEVWFKNYCITKLAVNGTLRNNALRIFETESEKQDMSSMIPRFGQ